VSHRPGSICSANLGFWEEWLGATEHCREEAVAEGFV
jgi:hypothetical protein